MRNNQIVISELTRSARLLEQLANESASEIREVGELLIERLSAGNKALIFGNGGSAADAQHFASELIGRYRQDREPFPALALTTDPSTLTSISNDYGFSEVFARQVRGLANRGDVVIGISTSGRSANVVAGLAAARDIGAHTVAMIGSDILGLGGLAEMVLSVPSNDTARVQEAHGVIIHILCHMVEEALSQPEQSPDPDEKAQT